MIILINMESVMSSKIDRLKELAEELSSYEIERKKNFKRVEELFEKLKLNDKIENFAEIFSFKAINLSGISLSFDALGKAAEGKYAQIIAISYVEYKGRKKAKNISLGYFGRADRLDDDMKSDIVEFILRWRLEKSFLGVDHYRKLLSIFQAQQRP